MNMINDVSNTAILLPGVLKLILDDVKDDEPEQRWLTKLLLECVIRNKYNAMQIAKIHGFQNFRQSILHTQPFDISLKQYLGKPFIMFFVSEANRQMTNWNISVDRMTQIIRIQSNKIRDRYIAVEIGAPSEPYVNSI